jgi:class 3 adenylate cyclase/TolB-like protein/tetratricopeptide (TPR) repeat protein
MVVRSAAQASLQIAAPGDPASNAVSEVRKLAAILVADIVGYSRLAGADEDRILARLRALRSDLIDPTIAVHHGRIVKWIGDGTIVEFRSVVDAVRCAIEVQNGLIERNVGLPPGRRIEFRVGIHLGDVVEEVDGDLMGDGVNIASRLEGVAKPGAICLSEQAYWQVKGRLDLKVTDLGVTQLKNIAEPIRVYSLEVGVPMQPKSVPPSQPLPVLKKWPAVAAALTVVVIAAGAYAWHSGLAPRLLGLSVAENDPPTAPRLSTVVLPFANLSGDPEQEYFADGITDDLTTDLSHLPNSFVISRGTAFTYKGRPVDAKQIGRELGVRYVLEGSVQRLGEAITINAQLISTDTGAHVWADRFDGERRKLGDLQVEVVARLANSLGVELVKAEALRASRERPNNPDAVDLVMHGFAILYSRPDKAVLKDAQTLFERALAIDAQNVSALVGLATTLSRRVNAFWSDDPVGDLVRAEETIDRALALQPQNSLAHSVKGDILSAKRQWPAAIAEAEAAISDDSNNAYAYAKKSLWQMFIGHSEDGFAGVEKALRLSPHDPNVGNWQFYMCHLHSHLAQWEQAIEWCRKAVTSNPKAWAPHVDLAAATTWAGHDNDAKEEAAQLQKVYPGFTVQTWAGIHWTDDVTFNAQYERIVEGLRKAGVPEGEAKTSSVAP